MIEKNNRLEEESFKCRRALEENASLQRKVEKLKRVEYLGYSDEILVEEVKMYKVRFHYQSFVVIWAMCFRHTVASFINL